MTTREFFTLLRRRLWWVAGGTVVAVLLASLALAVWPRTYESNAQLLISTVPPAPVEEGAEPAPEQTGEPLGEQMATLVEVARSLAG